MKTISVIIPVFNAEKYIAKCLESVCNQTYPVQEIIIINDGSNDTTIDICTLYQKKDNRIQVVNKENEGVSVARNIGLQIAKGDLISFIDADDALEPDMYEYLVKLLCDYDADIAHCGYKRMDENNAILNECSGTHIVLKQGNAEAIEYMLNGRLFAGGLWNKLFRRTILDNIYFDEKLKNNEDILFNALAFQNASIIVFGDETKYLYYEHSSSACNTLPDEKKSNDSRLAASILVQSSKTKQIQQIAQTWMFRLVLSSYKTGENCKNVESRKWLKSNYATVKKLTFSDKVNYYLSVYCPFAFNIVYSLHKTFRKPKWDPKI